MGHVVRTKRWDFYVSLTKLDHGARMEISVGEYIVRVIVGSSARQVLKRGFKEIRNLDNYSTIFPFTQWVRAP